MLTISKTVTPSPAQWEIVLEGMRNPHDSWDNMDSYITHFENPETLETADYQFYMGKNDRSRAMNLSNGGSVHAKYRRQLPVHAHITAPLYFWKEFETYRTGVAPNPTDIELDSCSTMHRVTAKEFTMSDFSHEHLFTAEDILNGIVEKGYPIGENDLIRTIGSLNYYRKKFLETEDMNWWWQIIQTLPSSYNQKRTLFINYEALSSMYFWRHNHKLDEWRQLCRWIENLPYSELITRKGE